MTDEHKSQTQHLVPAKPFPADNGPVNGFVVRKYSPRLQYWCRWHYCHVRDLRLFLMAHLAIKRDDVERIADAVNVRDGAMRVYRYGHTTKACCVELVALPEYGLLPDKETDR